MDYFAKNLKYLREKFNISQNKLAQRLKVNHTTVMRWERGEVSAGLSNAYDVSQIFNVNISDLLTQDLQYNEKANQVNKEMGNKLIVLPRDIGKWHKGDSVKVEDFMQYIDKLKKRSDKLEQALKLLKEED